RINRYKNRLKFNINPSDGNSEQSVDKPSESSEYTTKEDNISGSSNYDISDKIQHNGDSN
ncbi:19723_t:CDS:2, partial [Funneliformis geosporum]